MDYEKIVQKRLKDHPKRLKHTYGVVKRALELGKIYKADLRVLEIAALFHDITKHETDAYHQSFIKEETILSYPKPMWHAFSAAELAKNFGIDDERIIEAIKYHVFGKIKMRLETLIIVVSDFCEEGRTFPLAKKIYEVALVDLEKAYLMSLESQIAHLEEKGLTPINIQKETYLYYKKKGLNK